MYKIAIIGAGNMGGAIASGLARKGYDIWVANPHQDKLQALKAKHPGLNVTTSNTEAIADADLIILAVKPWIIKPVLDEIADKIDYDKSVIASLAAPFTLADLQQMFGDHGQQPDVMKIIPNTAIAVGHSMTFVSIPYEKECYEMPVKLLGELGEVAVIDEQFMQAATALCSCGIAHAFRYVRACTEGAVELGLRPADALRYEIETLRGAVELLAASGNNPEVEVDKVTTAGGITIRGLNAMERAGFSSAVIEGLKASK